MTKTKVITSKVRFSYLQVFEAKAMSEGQTPKFSVSLIIDKSDKKLIAQIEAAIKAATEEGKAKLGGTIPKNLKTPLRDGDTDRDEEAYANSMFVNANTVRRPGLVDADVNPIISRDELKSGDYGRASINFYAYNTGTSKGIACGLNNLQKLEDGESLGGGGVSAEADFGGPVDDLL